MLGRTADGLIARFGWRRGLRLILQLKLAKLLPAGTEVRVDAPILDGPARLRARTTDALVLKELLLKGNFDFAVPVPPRFIVDAGANIGLVSAFLATRFPEARIVALEIDSANFEQLCRNVRSYPNVVPMHAGLWSHATSVAVANPDSREWAFRATERPSIAEPSAERSVPAFSVADLMRRFNARQVDVLKVDIEGGELEVFGPEAEQWVDRVALIAVELHDRLVPGCERVVADRLQGRFTRSRSGQLDIFTRAPTRGTPAAS
jgi:FkbM family methyltransferase